MAIEWVDQICFQNSKISSKNRDGRPASRSADFYGTIRGKAGTWRLLISTATLLLAATDQAYAAALAPTFTYSSALAQTCIDGTAACNEAAIGTTLASQTSGNATTSARIDLSKAPSVSTRGESYPQFGNAGTGAVLPTTRSDGKSLLIYEFRLVGPSLAVIPFHFVSSGFVELFGDKSWANPNQLNGNGVSYASIEVERIGASSAILLKQSITVNNTDLDSTGHAYKSFSIDQVINLSTVSVFDVTIEVDSGATVLQNQPGAPTVGGLVALANVDPYVYIDPAYADRYKDYSLEFSGGIVNSLAPVPIPAGGPMFATTLIALGARLCRKRLKAPHRTAAIQQHWRVPARVMQIQQIALAV